MKIDYTKLDHRVIPMVKFFNANGLETGMSCQGHGPIKMSMFWISFAQSTTIDDIIRFQRRFYGKYADFCSNGTFANVCWAGEDNTVHQEWRYMAATVAAADDDLDCWSHQQKGK